MTTQPNSDSEVLLGPSVAQQPQQLLQYPQTTPGGDEWTGVDKDELFGRFEQGEERREQLRLEERRLRIEAERSRNELARKAQYKALDIARDLPIEQPPSGEIEDMQVDNRQDNRKIGLGTRDVALLGTFSVASLLLGMFLSRPVVPVTPTPIDTDTDTQYELRFTQPKGKGWSNPNKETTDAN